MSTILKIGVLLLVFGATIYTGLIQRTVGIINDFNSNVVAFFPQEIRFVFLLIGFGLIYKIFISITKH